MPGQPGERRLGRPNPQRRPDAFASERQRGHFGPIFRRLADVLGRDPTGLELRADPVGLAPERLLVFEVRGEISTFADAIRRVPGLEFVDEDVLGADDADTNPAAYMMVPDAAALRQILRLWELWDAGLAVGVGNTPWRDVFALLRDLRAWGPQDRVQQLDADLLAEELADHPNDSDLITLEVELIYRAASRNAADAETAVGASVAAAGGQILSRARIEAIAYHALLVTLPAAAVRSIVARMPASIACLEPVMYIRPQSVASRIEVEELGGSGEVEQPASLGEPILAILDGVPIARHPLLAAHLQVDDMFELERDTTVDERKHGSAMASLIIHGDRNRPEPSLPRQILNVPVLGAGEGFPANRLAVDLVYQAVLKIRDGADAAAPNTVIVNISLGNCRRPFHGSPSPWARLLDALAHKYGILFVVSAGNVTGEFRVDSFGSRMAFEDAATNERAKAVIAAVGNVMADRRLFSPAETVNGITVGASNIDNVTPQDRVLARINVDPFGEVLASNPSSALGPGFVGATKPEILMPGARERLMVVDEGDEHLSVRPSGPSRAAGLKVAGPPRDGNEGTEGFTNGTSAAAALASRTAHRIHDALESEYGDEFLSLPEPQRAALLKALLVHPARWPDASAAFIREILGPADGRQHVRQKDNIRRFLGYGVYDPDDAVACAADRATFWAVGMLARDQSVPVVVPVPIAYGARAQFHSISATLAWFTPVHPGRRSYRTVRLKLLEPESLNLLSLAPHSSQPDGNQSSKGTVFTRCWSGQGAAVVQDGMNLDLLVQRQPDAGSAFDEDVAFGLAVTLSMPGAVELYQQVQQRLGIVAPVRT